MYKKGSIHVELFTFCCGGGYIMPIHTLWWWYRISIRTSENPAWTLDPAAYPHSWRWIWEIVAHFFSLLKESAPRKMHNVHVWGSLSHVWESYLCSSTPLAPGPYVSSPPPIENFWYNISKTEDQDALSTVSQLATLVSSDRIKDRKFPGVSHVRILFQFYNVCEFSHSVKCIFLLWFRVF